MRRDAAFSLVEVMCAIAILAIGLTGLTEGLSTALRSTRESELQTRAILFASGQIETLRAEGYLTDGETEGECGDVLSSCTWRQTLVPAGMDGLHEVTLKIEQESSGKTVCELRTLLFERPVSSSEQGAGRSRESQRRNDRGGGRRQ